MTQELIMISEILYKLFKNTEAIRVERGFVIIKTAEFNISFHEDENGWYIAAVGDNGGTK